MRTEIEKDIRREVENPHPSEALFELTVDALSSASDVLKGSLCIVSAKWTHHTFRIRVIEARMRMQPAVMLDIMFSMCKPSVVFKKISLEDSKSSWYQSKACSESDQYGIRAELLDLTA